MKIGQIELYTHHRFFPTLVSNLSRLGIRTCAAYLIESQFMEDKYKFFRLVSITELFFPAHTKLIIRLRIYSSSYPRCMRQFSGVLSAMSSMVNLEVPWINIMTKMDLVTAKSDDPASGRNGIRKKRNIARYGER